MKRHLAGTGLVLAAALVAAAARSASAGPAEDTAAYSLNLFSDVDGVNVYTHYLDYGHHFAAELQADLQWVHDVVVIPALDAPPGSVEAIDAITTASRPITNLADAYEDFVKVRDSLQASVSWQGLSAGYYLSSESDYFAQMISAGYNRGLLGENLNLSVGAAYSWDRIEPVADGQGQAAPAERNTVHLNAVATQVLTPLTVLRVGLELNEVQGQQHDPYRSVYVTGSIVPERHPTERSRRDAFVRLSRYLGAESSLQADFRYYTDDWDITSQTWGLKLNQRITRALTMRYRYRYYSQLPAWFYRDDYRSAGAVDGYQTGDYRLGDYGSHLFGGECVIVPEGLMRSIGFMRSAELVFAYERYFNSNNFTANIIGTSLRISF